MTFLLAFFYFTLNDIDKYLNLTNICKKSINNIPRSVHDFSANGIISAMLQISTAEKSKNREMFVYTELNLDF